MYVNFSATRLPFEVTFYSDGFEFTDGTDMAEASQAQAGVKLNYEQDGTTC